MSTAEEYKNAGNAAWSSGNYDEAIKQFTSAIGVASSSEFLKTIYSNRSAAYMKISQYQSALLDANKCIEIDCNWAKGYVRKGDALYSLKKYTECYNAYNYALRITPNDTSVQQKCELAQKAIRDSVNDTQQQQQQQQQQSNSRPSTQPSSKNNTFESIQNYLRIFLVLNALLYFIPFSSSFSYGSYHRFNYTSIINYGISLYLAYGIPQFNMGYLQRIMLDPTTIYLFLAILLLGGRPYFLGLMPILLTEGVHVAYYISILLQNRMPSVLDRVDSLLVRYLPQLMQKTPDEWRRLGSQSKWKQFSTRIASMSAYCEVMQGILLLFELILPTRNIMYTVIWWQYLQMRYMLDQSGIIKTTFIHVDNRIMTLLSHRLCPSVLLSGYGYLKVFLAKQVQPPTAEDRNQGLSGMMSKCTVM
mmetsp:Transcript_23083/g.23738  ORF Transcript_23083/g.23738 Transcript_23083/m.23738 type:complete len:418 (-) Transcript_23083:27-1280(-)